MTSHKTILIVDDDEQVLRLFSFALQCHGLSVHTACDGQEALAASARQRFDLIITDSLMPMLELVMDARKSQGKVPLLLTSGSAGPVIERIARQLEADAFLHKPFEVEELLATVDRLTQRVSAAGK